MRKIVLACAFLCAAGVYTQEPPTESECRELYLRRIQDLSQNAMDPASPAILLKRDELLKDEAVAAAVDLCKKNYSAEYVTCAKSAGDPKECGPKDSNVEAPTKTEPQAETPPSRIATSEECARSYDYLLSLYATPEFLKKPGAQKMVDNWKSDVSRRSFKSRCTKAFHKQDIDCIFSSKDTDYVRACLLLIPE